MILNGNVIKKLIENKCIKNATYSNISGASLDLRLSKHFKEFSYDVEKKICLKSPIDLKYKDYEGEYTLNPKEFVLASSMEFLDLPEDICGFVTLRSSAARLGIDHGLAGWIDPGFTGNITFELINNHARNISIILSEEDRVAQVCFYRVEAPDLEFRYRKKGKSMGQENTTESRGMI